PPSGKASFGRRLKLNGRNIRKQDFQDSLRQRLLLGNSRDHLNGRHRREAAIQGSAYGSRLG
ncbi:hypothetical protein, partial [Mesorhizobium sp.]|uniref:hypothetical protein n=1 Tax=Mesorhizobium sp. TaxID=1871066 RepID=UPI00257F3BAF